MENIVAKGEIARFMQIAAEASESVYMREWVKLALYTTIFQWQQQIVFFQMKFQLIAHKQLISIKESIYIILG